MMMKENKIFKLGRDIACTSGKIIYQNDIMQLIEYTATTKKTYQHPLLIIPSWINKFYIFDLQPENSFVKWLIDQGYIIYMISWVNANSDHHEKNFSNYLIEGPLTALEIIKKRISNKINLLGYCIGGTLLGCMLAYLKQKKNDVNIQSATFLTTLFDFSNPGELKKFIDEHQMNLMEEFINQKGYLDGRALSFVFNLLRINDVNTNFKKQKPPFDLLHWNADSTNIPAALHRFFIRNMYLNNLLAESGKLKINNVSLDLGQINTPSYFFGTDEDHIIPWKSCYQSKKLLKKSVKFVLGKGGHVAGVINPPHKKKYGYWTNKLKPSTPEKFLATANFHEGSWWTDWSNWLKKYAGNLVVTKKLDRKTKILENAPGSYVRVKLMDFTG